VVASWFINFSSAITLTVFTVFFASLTFQLNGPLIQKIGLLAVGNFIGLLWNLIFFYLSWIGCQFLGLAFDVIYTLIYPLLNLMWIVPFWSLSMCILPKFENKNQQVQL
jgi:hypothetical protein